MDTSCESFPSQLMLSSGQASAVAQRFFPGSDFELFKNAATLEAIDVPPEWPLPPDIYIGDKKAFVAKGDDFVAESVYWRLVVTLIVEKILLYGFDNIKQHFVNMGQSESDGALSRREGTNIKLVAILEAKTPGSETAHPDKKVSPHLSLLLENLIYDLIGERLGYEFRTSFCVCGTSLAHGRRRLNGHPI